MAITSEIISAQAVQSDPIKGDPIAAAGPTECYGPQYNGSRFFSVQSAVNLTGDYKITILAKRLLLSQSVIFFGNTTDGTGAAVTFGGNRNIRFFPATSTSNSVLATDGFPDDTDVHEFIFERASNIASITVDNNQLVSQTTPATGPLNLETLGNSSTIETLSLVYAFKVEQSGSLIHAWDLFTETEGELNLNNSSTAGPNLNAVGFIAGTDPGNTVLLDFCPIPTPPFTP